MWRIALLFMIGFSLTPTSVSCGGVNIDFENRTGRELSITVTLPTYSPKSKNTFSLKPGSKTGYSYPGLVENDEVIQVEARDPAGNPVYSETLMLGELKERGLRFVFTSAVPVTPTPSH